CSSFSRARCRRRSWHSPSRGSSICWSSCSCRGGSGSRAGRRRVELARPSAEDAGTCTARETTALRRFAEDVRVGLGSSPKHLPCVYLYDARGSELFDRITRLPEYYLTQAESEIIEAHAARIADAARGPIHVVELGSGTSAKTVALLEALVDANGSAIYRPIDVCADVLRASAEVLTEAVPGVTVKPIRARYIEGLERVDADGEVLLLWLGSSIGNLERDRAAQFLSRLRGRLSPGDRLLIGFDLVKDVGVLAAAYNDSSGVTAEFNLNLLRRINRELGGDFELERFRHIAHWNPDHRRIEMYLESLEDQRVTILNPGLTVEFSCGERVHTENSHKYTLGGIAALAEDAGLEIEERWLDSRKYFSLHSLRVPGL
ncbi:MAG: L-histidine N(alpha)-methyltransferase, partial [Candidatus Eisenbacteria bacterium]|nr:L-histidine N(alpha)-methyltransferase [Candidatus Eisenbacteria bacterium]